MGAEKGRVWNGKAISKGDIGWVLWNHRHYINPPHYALCMITTGLSYIPISRKFSTSMNSPRHSIPPYYYIHVGWTNSHPGLMMGWWADAMATRFFFHFMQYIVLMCSTGYRGDEYGTMWSSPQSGPKMGSSRFSQAENWLGLVDISSRYNNCCFTNAHHHQSLFDFSKGW